MSESRTQPNIVLIMSDNQPADLLGCYGNSEVHTPHLDSLARDGIQFSNAYCVNAMCSPCRASVMTGLMPSQHGVHNWLDDTLISKWPDKWSAISEFNNIPTLMKQAGYMTAMIGKYHLGIPFEPQLAFDHWVTFPHGHTTSFYGNDVIDQEERYRFEGHTVDFFTDKAVEFIRDQKGKQEPFFAFIPFNGPYGHWPAIKGRAENEFADLYDDIPLDSIPREGLDPKILDRFGLRVHESGGEVREQFKGPLLLPNNVESLRNYFSQVSLIDRGVGKIHDTLNTLGMSENTIVIYTSDHGFSLGHNGIWGHGAATWPSTTHRVSFNIPLIVSGGPIKERKTICDEIISQIDLFPTLASLAGFDAKISLPSTAQDFSTYLAGGDQTWRETVFMEQEETRSIRSKEWLYMMRFKGSAQYPLADAFYNIRKDPLEKINLIDDAHYVSIQEDLRAQIENHFDHHSEAAFDLWSGGSAKSNVTFAGLWKDAWGENWTTQFGS